ncbi:MAG: UDP-glucose 4-epimerase GalE [Bryobacteraceae bacterium]
MARILVTGGAGYIGSHTAHYLLRLGHDVQVVDDLSYGYRHNVPEGRLHVLNLLDTAALDAVLARFEFEAVVHFAAFISVGESTRKPEMYFRNNCGATFSLLDAMARAGVRRIVFSSTAAVYGNPERTPITEDMPHRPVNPYGQTKLMVETAMRWMDQCSGLRFVALRYFNACGAEEAYGIGEEHAPETHLIPLVLRAARTGEPLTIFGQDYPTPDGTCIRDYIHVTDLAAAHAAALDHLLGGGASASYNAGTGHGYSVLEVIRAVERVTGQTVPFQIGPRREGDPAVLVADSTKLQQTLGWKPGYTTLDAMVESAWKFDRRKHGP